MANVSWFRLLLWQPWLPFLSEASAFFLVFFFNGTWCWRWLFNLTHLTCISAFGNCKWSVELQNFSFFISCNSFWWLFQLLLWSFLSVWKHGCFWREPLAAKQIHWLQLCWWRFRHTRITTAAHLVICSRPLEDRQLSTLQLPLLSVPGSQPRRSVCRKRLLLRIRKRPWCAQHSLERRRWSSTVGRIVRFEEQLLQPLRNAVLYQSSTPGYFRRLGSQVVYKWEHLQWKRWAGKAWTVHSLIFWILLSLV